MSDKEFFRPDNMLSRVIDYVNALDNFKNSNNLKRVASHLSIIETVLKKLRHEYRNGNLTDDQIETLKNLSKNNIEPAKTLIRKEITERHDRLYRQHMNTPSPGVEFSNGSRKTVCFYCHAELEECFDLNCNACKWIVCWCGACGCIKQRLK